MAKAPNNLKGVCDRCGLGFLFKTLSKQWDGLMACPQCFDIKHPALHPARPIGPEGLSPRDIRPLEYHNLPDTWYFYDADGTAWNYDDGTFAPP